ncbi:hypothetical protein AGMMS49546_12430 [Spirochaetia bacterium]|nr:hypothetical protein AGMMS49546_12430 [Spirochaetia bacterium]
MKKSLMLLAIVLLLGASFVSCSKKDAPAAGKAEPAKILTHDELVAAAKAEGRVVVYSITSRISSASEAFEKLYGIKVEYSNLKDGELIEKVTKEVGAR